MVCQKRVPWVQLAELFCCMEAIWEEEIEWDEQEIIDETKEQHDGGVGVGRFINDIAVQDELYSTWAKTGVWGGIVLGCKHLQCDRPAFCV